MEILDHKITLSNFYGPMDLLLYLIREDELNIYDIPISRVTEQYLNYLALMEKLNIEIAGEFLVMASTLMEVKARLLVPPPEEDLEEEEADPRFELIRRLLEYKKFKDLSARLRECMAIASRTSCRPYFDLAQLTPDAEKESAEEKPVVELDLWNLARTFSRISQEIILDVPSSIIYDDIPIEKFMGMIIERLKQKGEMSFLDLLANQPEQKRFYTLKNLIASLELVRLQQIDMEQERDFGDIKLRLRADAPPAPEGTGPAGQN
ncbi:MAG: segregation/condensation protein A [Candidatus Brocadiia bacterium]